MLLCSAVNLFQLAGCLFIRRMYTPDHRRESSCQDRLGATVPILALACTIYFVIPLTAARDIADVSEQSSVQCVCSVPLSRRGAPQRRESAPLADLCPSHMPSRNIKPALAISSDPRHFFGDRQHYERRRAGGGGGGPGPAEAFHEDRQGALGILARTERNAARPDCPFSAWPLTDRHRVFAAAASTRRVSSADMLVWSAQVQSSAPTLRRAGVWEFALPPTGGSR